MAREREIVREPVHREVIVDERPSRGGGGGIVAAIIGVVLVLLIGWFLLNALGILGEATEDGVNVDVPEVNVETDG